MEFFKTPYPTKHSFYPTHYTPVPHSNTTLPFSSTVNSLHQPSIFTPPSTNLSPFFSTTTSNETYQMVPQEQATHHHPDETYLNFVFFVNVILLPITAILGLLGNLTSIVVLHKDRYNRVAVFLLQNLALANCFLLLISLFVLTISYAILQEVVDDYVFEVQPFLVVYINPFGSISHCYVIWSTILLALNRYAAICRPFTSKNFLKLSSARIQVAIVVTLTVCFALPQFFIFVLERYYCTSTQNTHDMAPPIRPRNTHITTQNTLKCFSNKSQINKHDNIDYKFNFTHSELGDNQHFQMYYQTIFYTFVVLILPLFLLIALHVPLIRQLQRSKKLMKHNCLVYDGKNEDNITIAMVVIIIMMVICHVMERICEVVKHLSGEEKSDSPLLYAQNISNYFVLLSSSTDFIVYYILKKRFRKEFWRKVYSCLGKETPYSCGESVGGPERRISVLKHSLKSDSIPHDNYGGRGGVGGVGGNRGVGGNGVAGGVGSFKTVGGVDGRAGGNGGLEIGEDNNFPDLVVNRYGRGSKITQIELDCLKSKS